MGRHPVAVVILHTAYARTMKVDYSRFSYGRATWEACSGILEKKIAGTTSAFSLGPRKTKTSLGVFQPVCSITRHKILIRGYRSLSNLTFHDIGQTFWFLCSLGAHSYLHPLIPKVRGKAIPSWPLYWAIFIVRWKKPTNAQGCCKRFIVLIKSPTCFGIQMPSSGDYLFLFKLLQF
jgi:hypothetical protein